MKEGFYLGSRPWCIFLSESAFSILMYYHQHELLSLFPPLSLEQSNLLRITANELSGLVVIQSLPPLTFYGVCFLYSLCCTIFFACSILCPSLSSTCFVFPVYPLPYNSPRLQPATHPGSGKLLKISLLWQRVPAPPLHPQQQVVNYELQARHTRSLWFG